MSDHRPDTNQGVAPAKELHWRGNAPVSEAFDDVYYSAENGLEETQFVFLHGTGAPDVWQGKDRFVIAETGFGTGLNFLATWKAWRESGAKGRLIFISVEGFPLGQKALEEAHETFPELAAYARELRAAWPPASNGTHPRYFDNGKVSLILLFGHVESAFRNLHATVDAWFLDGFAPAKNPEMWSDSVMDQIARLSKPGTRFATFTAAGFVRRALQARGFDVTKAPGYGRKRERLVGQAVSPAPTTPAAFPVPEWAITSPAPDGHIAIIGGGIAGASLAAALNRRNRKVTVITSEKHAAASHVPAAILAPRFMLEDNPSSAFFAAAYAYSCWFPGFQAAWAETGGISLLPKNDRDSERLAAIADRLGWASDWLIHEENGLTLPRGGSLAPKPVLETLLNDVATLEAEVLGLKQTGKTWAILGAEGPVIEAETVIVAAGMGSMPLLGAEDSPDLRPNRGQVEVARASHLPELPVQSLAFGGYVTADMGDQRTIGSTFDRLDSAGTDAPTPSAADREKILQALRAVTRHMVAPEDIDHSWAGLRATTADHLPFAGPICHTAKARAQYAALAKDASTTGLGAPHRQSGLYVLAGLGSKGFQYGPYLAEYLAAQICGDPLTVPSNMIAPLHPLRGLIKRIKQGKG